MFYKYVFTIVFTNMFYKYKSHPCGLSSDGKPWITLSALLL